MHFQWASEVLMIIGASMCEMGVVYVGIISYLRSGIHKSMHDRFTFINYQKGVWGEGEGMSPCLQTSTPPPPFISTNGNIANNSQNCQLPY